MATATDPRPVNRPKPALPAERFWKRYSPNHELPLSGASSFALHTLLIGLILLVAWVAWALGLNSPPPTVPTEGVRLAPGGTGARKDDKVQREGDDRKPAGERADDQRKSEEPDSDPQRPRLDPKIIKAQTPTEIKKDPLAKRHLDAGTKLEIIQDLNTEVGKKLREAARRRPGSGESGTGQDGKKDDRKDRGSGDAEGTGTKTGKLTESEKRMLRWQLNFTTSGRPNDYFNQLKALGAILAVPTADGCDYAIVFPADQKGKDVSGLNRIYWKDYDRKSIASVMQSLGIKDVPSHFVAFMPRPLEDELAALEKAHAQKNGKTVEDVFETKFQVIPRGTGYVPQLKTQTYLPKP